MNHFPVNYNVAVMSPLLYSEPCAFQFTFAPLPVPLFSAILDVLFTLPAVLFYCVFNLIFFLQ